MAFKKERDTPLVPASSIPSNSCAPPFWRVIRRMCGRMALQGWIKVFTINACRSIRTFRIRRLYSEFGEMMFQALTTTDHRSKIPTLKRFAFFHNGNGVGATVITAISMKTPTAQIIIVAIAIAAVHVWPVSLQSSAIVKPVTVLN